MIAQHTPVAVVRIEPDYWSGGHFHTGHRKCLEQIATLVDVPVGTKLYAATALIAAAPDLLRELRAAYRVLVHLPGSDDLLADIDAAIAKATGKQ